jgi:hypothetical protein
MGLAAGNQILSSKVDILNTDSKVEIFITPDKSYTLFYLTGMLMWCFLGFCFIFISNFICTTAPLVMLAFIIWVIGALLMLFMAYWHLEGKEIIILENGNLSLKTTIKNKPYERTFKACELHNLRRTNITDNISIGNINTSFIAKTIYSGQLAFDAGEKTYKFGFQLDKHDAHEIMVILSQKLKTSSLN